MTDYTKPVDEDYLLVTPLDRSKRNVSLSDINIPIPMPFYRCQECLSIYPAKVFYYEKGKPDRFICEDCLPGTGEIADWSQATDEQLLASDLKRYYMCAYCGTEHFFDPEDLYWSSRQAYWACIMCWENEAETRDLGPQGPCLKDVLLWA